MSKVLLFPGQGSQFRGMGKDLFPKYPELVSSADDLLGYSIEKLCLLDQNTQLAQTQFTQPALYVVNALSYLEYRESQPMPDYIAGHSLGEFNALMAAEAFDFITGLSLVKKRGELMAKATGGAMAAVLGLELDDVLEILEKDDLSSIDIANINSKTQIIISGLSDDLQRCDKAFEKAGAKYIPLNVSAAFHSRYMKDIQSEFSKYLESVETLPIRQNVISNWTADLYPNTDYKDHISNQLVSPVKWYQSISRLVSSGYTDFKEQGPGHVLTRLADEIIKNPAKVKKLKQSTGNPPVELANIFMFAGEGAYYHEMGKELYDGNKIFRESVERCDKIVSAINGRSIIDTLYSSNSNMPDMDDVINVHPAIFTFGYSLTQMLNSQGVEPDGVLGYGLGEIVAATIAKSLTLESALDLIVMQATAISNGTQVGGMLAVVSDISHYHDNPQIYETLDLARLNYKENYVLSGSKEALVEVQEKLDKLSIPSMMLAVEHGFNSRHIADFEGEFKNIFNQMQFEKPNIPVYSSSVATQIEGYTSEHLWKVNRELIRFSDLMSSMKNSNEFRFIDCSPTGTLSNYIKYSEIDVEHHAVISPIDHNLDTVNKLVTELSGFTS